MPDTKVAYQKELDALRADLTQLREDVGGLLSALRDQGRERLGEARDRTREELDSRIEQLRETYQKARNKTGRAAKSAYQGLENHPLSSIAIAFGAGLIFGKLLKSK